MSRRPGGALPPFVKAYKVNGRRVYYFRRGKDPLIRLRGEFESPEWNRQYAAALAGAPLPNDPPPFSPRGSFNLILDQFEASPDWLTALKPASRKYLRASLRYLRKRWGDKQVASVEPAHVKSLLRGAATGKDKGTVAAETYSAAAHNAMLQALNKVYKFAEIELRLDPRNRPTFGMAKLPLDCINAHVWTEAEIEQFRKFWPVGSVARLAFELLFETGARGRSDVIRLGWKDVGPDKILRFEPKKTNRARRKRSVPVDFAEFRSPYLAACLDLVPAPTMARELPFILYQGEAYDADGDLFGRHFAKWCKLALLPDHCRAHGVRRAFGTRAANDGATPYEVGAMLGDTDAKSIEVYTKGRSDEMLALRGRRRYKAA